jgi:pimeloyl-ACP methyl ester carboxylesterase
MPNARAIQYRRYGSGGEAVALLHGGPGAAGEMATVARRLGARLDAFEPLQRGSGTVPLTVATHVTDLRELIHEVWRVAPVRLVGFSWGAMLALSYAARHPGDVERVVAIGCGTLDAEARRIYQTRMAERMDAKTRSLLCEIEDSLTAEADHARRNDLFAELGRIYTRLQAFDPREIRPDESSSCDEQAFRETWADAVSLQERGIQPAEFSRIAAPVTMIHGEADPHPGRLIHESLKPFIARLTYVEIPDCGHKPWIERRAEEAFYGILTECLS